jgi:ribosomal protein S11
MGPANMTAGPQGEQGNPGPNELTTSTATPLTGVFCGNGVTVGICSILQDISYATSAGARQAADLDIQTNKSATILEVENQFAANDTSALNNAILAAKANATLPASSVTNDIVTFSDTTGKVLKDSGTLISSLITSVAPVTKELENQFAANDTSILNNALVGANSNETAARAGAKNEAIIASNANATLPASSVTNDIVTFSDTTGKVLKDSGISISSLATAAADRLAADLDIASNVTMIFTAEQKNRSADRLTLDQHIASNDTMILSAELLNTSTKIAGGTASGSTAVNASSIPVFTDSLGRAVNGTNVTITGNGVNGPNILDMGLGQVRDMADPTASQDAATKNYVDTEDAADVTAAKAYTDTNASKWLSVTSNRFAYSNTTVLKAGTSFTVNSTTHFIVVELVGGGGGGGGASANAADVGGGGGSGGYAMKFFPVTPSAAYTYAIGAGGTAGPSTGGVAGAGGASSFTVSGVTVTANGGSGGNYMAGSTAANVTFGGAGATVSTNGDVNGAGDPGQPGIKLTTSMGMSGAGGSSVWGGGGKGRDYPSGTNVAGNAGAGCGGGGSGGLSGGAARAGGAGAQGCITVWEYV